MILAVIDGVVGVAVMLAALFCAYGAGILIEQVGADTQNKRHREMVMVWFTSAFALGLISCVFMFSAGKNL